MLLSEVVANTPPHTLIAGQLLEFLNFEQGPFDACWWLWGVMQIVAAAWRPLQPYKTSHTQEFKSSVLFKTTLLWTFEFCHHCPLFKDSEHLWHG